MSFLGPIIEGLGARLGIGAVEAGATAGVEGAAATEGATAAETAGATAAESTTGRDFNDSTFGKILGTAKKGYGYYEGGKLASEAVHTVTGGGDGSYEHVNMGNIGP